MTFEHRLRRRLRERLRIDVDYFFSAGLWGTLTLVLDGLFGFALSLLLLRRLSATDLGQWYWIVAAVSFLSLFTLPGSMSVVTRSMARGHFSSYFAAFRLRLVGGLFSAACAIAVAAYLSLRGSDPTLILLSAAYFPLCAFALYSRYYLVKERFRLSFLQYCLKALALYGSTFALLLSGAPLPFVVLAYLYSQALVDVALFLHSRKAVRAEPAAAEDPSLRRATLFVSALGFFAVALNTVDRLLFPLFVDVHTLALYGVVLLLPHTIVAIEEKFIVFVFSKKFSTLQDPRVAVLRSSLFIAAGVTVFSSLVAVALPRFFSFLVTPAYADQLPLAQLLVLALPLAVVGEYLRSYFELTNGVRDALLVRALPFALFLLLLVPAFRFGLLGLVVLRIACDALRTLVAYGLLLRRPQKFL